MLGLNLQFFAQGEEDDFDLDAFQKEFEAEWDENNDDETDVSTEDTEQTEEEIEVEKEEPEVEEPGDDEKQEDLNPNADDETKRNQAFANLRKQAEENKKFADFVQKIADSNGIKPEDVLARYEEQQLEKQAEQKGVPVDVLKRLNALEEENNQIKNQSKIEQFDNQVRSTIEKHELKDEDVRNVFQYMADNGYAKENDLPSISFEDAYFLANRDTIIQKQVEASRQKELEEKQKRQKSSALPSGNSVSQTDEITDEYVDEMLAKFDIRI